ncbi:MAG: uracil-DNA glycosylase [Vagococcus sp.]
MEQLIQTDWKDILADTFHQPYFKQLSDFLEAEYKHQVIYPKKENLFEALNKTPYQQTQVLILGQDPYHGPNQAHGLSFSVLPGSKIPPSLRNIYKELESDLGYPAVQHGFLEAWANQGVLLLNTVLTVRDGQPNSHRQKGWEQFTDTIITELNKRDEPVIFVLWGKPAQQKATMIDATKHTILTAPHPSPLSAYRGFFGSKPFSSINDTLLAMQKNPINWQLPGTVL